MAHTTTPNAPYKVGQWPGNTGGMGGRDQGRAETHEGFTDTLRDAAGQVRDTVQNAASTAAGWAEDAWDSTRQGARTVAHTAGDACSSMNDLIRRYPVASVLVAFGAGYLAATLCNSGPRWLMSDDVARRMSRASY